ncbi:hypothetical protein DFH06DRAFT_1135858 [Mycena polygramma]|nr:hypothetical protein DFH06DRAFT_1135858 [Mycena polygramma]
MVEIWLEDTGFPPPKPWSLDPAAWAWPTCTPNPGPALPAVPEPVVEHISPVHAPANDEIEPEYGNTSHPHFPKYQTDEESSEPPEAWLYDSTYQTVLPRIKVRVQGTQTPPQYLGGEFEGQEAHVSATVKFESGSLRVGFPVKYLWPVEPRLKDDEVLVLQDLKGSYQGIVMKLQAAPDPDSTRPLKVSPLGTADVLEMRRSSLGLLWPGAGSE